MKCKKSTGIEDSLQPFFLASFYLLLFLREITGISRPAAVGNEGIKNDVDKLRNHGMYEDFLYLNSVFFGHRNTVYAILWVE